MAIAIDATALKDYTPGPTTALTCSTLTIGSGSNRYLFVVGHSNVGDTVTGITWNGVSMTQLSKKVCLAGDCIYIYGLANPDSGNHNIVMSSSSSSYMGILAASYTGVNQTGQPDAVATGSAASVTSLTSTVTTIADNCWLLAVYRWDGAQALSAGTNSYLRVTLDPGLNDALLDSNAAQTPAGSKSLQGTIVSANNMNYCIISFAPYSAPPAATHRFFQMF